MNHHKPAIHPSRPEEDAGGGGFVNGDNGSVTPRSGVAVAATPDRGWTPTHGIVFTIRFAEPVTGLTLEDIQLSNGAKVALQGQGTDNLDFDKQTGRYPASRRLPSD